MINLTKPVYAVVSNPIFPDDSPVTTPKTYFNNVLGTVITVFMIVAVLYFFWHFVMAGFHLMDSRGDAKKLESAKEELLNAFIGLASIFAIFALLRFVGIIFGIASLQQLQIVWPDLL